MAIKNMKIDKAAIVQPDFELPTAAEVLHPVLFKEGDQYCCLLGPDPQAGVFGCGTSAQEAVNDWEQELKDRVNNAGASDKLTSQIIEELNAEATRRMVWEFENQFRPVKRK
ncbi:hypothetical protein [Pedobacter faecalis]|uniref:hypothetical protein n=1 Tax=Pedobacter faecalis TaxID=3041495 RepID=UPI0025505769|nr:hypothetical protein [Pedobacter sp. ELA7]